MPVDFDLGDSVDSVASSSSLQSPVTTKPSSPVSMEINPAFFQSAGGTSPESDKAKSSTKFVINFDDDLDPADGDFLQPTPAKAAVSSPAKKESPPAPVVSDPFVAAPPATSGELNGATSVDEGVASSTLSSWQQADPEEEPWVEVDFDKDVAPAKQVSPEKEKKAPLQVETPKKARLENKENIGDQNSNPSTPEKDIFLTPSIIRNKDFPSEARSSFFFLTPVALISLSRFRNSVNSVTVFRLGQKPSCASDATGGGKA